MSESKKPTPQQTSNKKYYSNASQIDTHIHATEHPNSKMSTIVQYNLTGGGAPIDHLMMTCSEICGQVRVTLCAAPLSSAIAGDFCHW